MPQRKSRFKAFLSCFSCSAWCRFRQQRTNAASSVYHRVKTWPCIQVRHRLAWTASQCCMTTVTSLQELVNMNSRFRTSWFVTDCVNMLSCCIRTFRMSLATPFQRFLVGTLWFRQKCTSSLWNSSNGVTATRRMQSLDRNKYFSHVQQQLLCFQPTAHSTAVLNSSMRQYRQDN